MKAESMMACQITTIERKSNLKIDLRGMIVKEKANIQFYCQWDIMRAIS